MYSRYYQQYYDFMRQLNPDGRFMLTPVPEPKRVVLLVAGLVLIMGVYARKRQT